jgi:acyl-CoA hydrolase
MEIGMRVEAENIRTRKVRHTNSCYFTMIAVDEAGKPIAAPQFQPMTELDRRRWRAAELRKELRKEHAARMQEISDLSK